MTKYVNEMEVLFCKYVDGALQWHQEVLKKVLFRGDIAPQTLSHFCERTLYLLSSTGWQEEMFRFGSISPVEFDIVALFPGFLIAKDQVIFQRDSWYKIQNIMQITLLEILALYTFISRYFVSFII